MLPDHRVFMDVLVVTIVVTVRVVVLQRLVDMPMLVALGRVEVGANTEQCGGQKRCDSEITLPEAPGDNTA
jgi:hypothetical protein